jgi:hypothetical protein
MTEPPPQTAAWAKRQFEIADSEFIEALTAKPNSPFTTMLKSIRDARFEYLTSFIGVFR